MKGPRSFRQLLTVAVALSPLASAWSNLLPDVGALVMRQDDATTTAERTTETTRDNDSEPTTTRDEDRTTTRDGDRTTTDSPRPTGDETTTTGRGPTTTNLNTGGRTTGTRSGSDSSEPTRTTFNPIDGAGSVVMVTPGITDAFPLYKIENPTPITWVWNYTQLQGTPTAIDVKVSCSVASATWTLTQNMTFQSPATFTWDTENFQTAGQDPLLTEEYTLLVHDSDGSPTDQAEPGYLAPFDGFRFGLYHKGENVSLTEWECVTCSAANGDLDRKALGFAVSMSAITVLTFTWYVAGFAGLL
ncbi:hypothetical protein DL764_004842 [Monosporascus ibericus]|uniref:DUF7137 domain-containing protein n=1 Tax=Monosporascus ibericus TaxID=155417 RepID=A0A4Q4TF27_9PEZI|nr:hypothetical protein DL764_004842 [Monosporascus ibericus]